MLRSSQKFQFNRIKVRRKFNEITVESSQARITTTNKRIYLKTVDHLKLLSFRINIVLVVKRDFLEIKKYNDDEILCELSQNIWNYLLNQMLHYI